MITPLEDKVRAPREILALSCANSIVLIIVYFVYLSTQMRSPKFAYKPLIELEPEANPETGNILEQPQTDSRHHPAHPHSPLLIHSDDCESQPTLTSVRNDEHRLVSLQPNVSTPLMPDFRITLPSSLWLDRILSVLLLASTVFLMSLCGSALVDSIDHLASHTPISKTVIGLIILPLVGNAPELISGIMFASKKRMDLAFAVSIGSAIQVALLVTPLVMLMAWGLGREMNLIFTVFEGGMLAASTVLFLGLAFDGSCSVLKGAWLCAGYTVIG